MKKTRLKYAALILFTSLLGLSSIQTGCGTRCELLPKEYSLSGCLGDAQCTVRQAECNIDLNCANSINCQGLLHGGEIYFSCSGNAGQKLSAVSILQQDNSHKVTFVKANKESCSGAFTPK